MVVLINKEAQTLLGVDYAVVWDDLGSLLESMRAPERNGSRISSFETKQIIEDHKSMKGDVIKGERCRKIAETLINETPTFQKEEKTRTKVWSDDAGELSIDRYLDDNELCWRKVARKKRKSKCIKLMAEISSTGFSKDEELLTRCGTIVALSQWLDGEGYEVEVYASDYSVGFFGNASQGSSELGVVKIKTADDMMDVEKLAAILCSQKFGYDILLRAIVNIFPYVPAWGWGVVKAIPSETLKSMGIDVSVPRNVMTVKDAKRWLSDTVEKLCLE